MSGYVVCPSCGSRIKAGRGHCLRCFETLPVEGAPEAPQAWFRSLQVSRGATLIAGVVLTLSALLLGVVIWEKATPPADEVARPAVSTARSASSNASPNPLATAPAQPADTLAASPARAPILEPGFVDATASEATSVATGDAAAARSALEQALAKQPDNAETLNKLGQALVRLGKIDEAIPRFERAAALSPDKWAYHFNLAHAASQLLLWDRAVAEYQRARTLRPGDYATQFDLAMALHKKGEDAAAIAEFEKAVKIAPGEAGGQLSLAICLEKVGRIPDAVRSYRRYLEMEPGSPDSEKLKAHVDALASAQPTASP